MTQYPTRSLNPFAYFIAPGPILFAVLAVCLIAGPAHSQGPGTAQARALSNAFSHVAETVSPSVVSIKVEAKAKHPRGFFSRRAPDSGTRGGSGFIFRSNGAILTNNHVVEDASRIEVKLQNGTTYPATVVGTDPATDLAVIKIDAKNLPAAKFADSDKARVGEWVVAIGSPFGLDYTLTVGVVSAKGRGIGANEIEDYIQTDASINPGNSGGPLMNLDGKVLGINTVIVGPRSAGVGFAIPANLVRKTAKQLLDQGEVSRAWIGVGFQELTPSLAKSFGTKVRSGALISHVEDGGPAEKAGLQAGDIIERVDNREIREGRDLLRSVLTKDVGQKVQLSVLRKGKNKKLYLITAARPGSEEVAQRSQPKSAKKSAVTAGFGLSVESLSGHMAKRMGYRGRGKLIIRHVAPGSPAHRAGLREADIIVEADQRRVKSPKQLERFLTDGQALLRIDRRGGSLFIALRKPR